MKKLAAVAMGLILGTGVLSSESVCGVVCPSGTTYCPALGACSSNCPTKIASFPVIEKVSGTLHILPSGTSFACKEGLTLSQTQSVTIEKTLYKYHVCQTENAPVEKLSSVTTFNPEKGTAYTISENLGFSCEKSAPKVITEPGSKTPYYVCPPVPKTAPNVAPHLSKKP